MGNSNEEREKLAHQIYGIANGRIPANLVKKADKHWSLYKLVRVNKHKPAGIGK